MKFNYTYSEPEWINLFESSKELSEKTQKSAPIPTNNVVMELADGKDGRISSSAP